MKADPQRILLDVRKATTDDLLDRATAYRAGMTAEALAMIEAELQDRGVGPDQLAAHAEQCRRDVLFQPDGLAAKCSFCDRPAVAQGWAMHRLWGRLPVFPRRFFYCKEHQRAPKPPEV
jgi:hypothetical protein